MHIVINRSIKAHMYIAIAYISVIAMDSPL